MTTGGAELAIVISADTSKAKSELSNLKGGLGEVAPAAEKAGAGLGELGHAATEATGEMGGLIGKVGDAVTALGEGGGLAGVIAVAVGGLAELGSSGGNLLNEMNTLAATLGSSTSEASKLSLTFEDATGSSQGLVRMAAQLNEILGQASTEIAKGGDVTGKAAILQDKLNISVGKGATSYGVLEQLLPQLSEMYQNAATRQEALSIATELFGVRGRELNVVLEDYAGLSEKAEQQERQLSAGWEDGGAKARAYNTAMTDLKVSYDQLALDSAPKLTFVLKETNQLLQGLDPSRLFKGSLIPADWVSGLETLGIKVHSTGEALDEVSGKSLKEWITGMVTASERTNDYGVSLSALQQHLSGLNSELTNQANTNRGLVNSEVESLRTSQEKSDVTKQAYAYIATLTDATSKQVTADHNASVAAKEAAEAKRAQSEADAAAALTVAGQVALLEKGATADHVAAEARREYAAANGLLVDSASNLLPTMSELVGKTQDSYIATQRDTEARREAYAAMGLETDSMGNLIQTTEQLVRAQEDSINASIRQSNATLQVAQQDFPHLVQQERQSILASQAMAKASAEANRQLIAEGLIADNTANSLDHLASAQYSVADYGTAALAPNFRPQDFTTIRNSPTVNGQGRSSSGGGASPSGGSVYRSSTSERPPAGFVGSFGGASYPAPRSSSTRSSARVVNQGTVINGNVYVTTSAQSFNAMQRI